MDASGAPLSVIENAIQATTPDGHCDAIVVHPTTGTYPGVLFWPDGFGLRPVMRAMAGRLASQGYTVFVPNPYYRVAKAPIVDDPSSFDFQNPADRARVMPFMASISAPGAAERDAAAYIAFLDAQPSVDRGRGIGTLGYCLGGGLVVKTAATAPDRVAAGASFHGGGLVTGDASSPHLLASRIKARMYIAIAANDDAQQPDAKETLRAAFSTTPGGAEIEVYEHSMHGWCVRDMPTQPNGAPIYNEMDAERAWTKLLALFKMALV